MIGGPAKLRNVEMDPRELMGLAIDKCRQGLAAGQSPFGCAIARDGKLLSCSHNTVVLTTDITAHAEVNAIREACRAAGDIFLTGAIVATTCEPCPMCMAALHWARVETVYYGATIADAETAGFNELQLPAAELLRLGGSQLKLVPEILPDECRQLFGEWNANPNRKVY
jgi:tRNA(Arg) A34 adenosine deaminase TadA